MTLYALKPRFQSALRPTVRRLALAGVTANQVTMISMAGSVLIGASIATWNEWHPVFLILPAWLVLRMALNAIDGMLAREFGQESRLGAYLNELGDVVSDAALYLPFALIAPFSPFWVVIAVVLMALSELAGVLGQIVGNSRRYEGPLGKSDRALVFGALGLWLGVAGALPPVLAYLIPLLSGLLVVTILRRVRAGLAGGKP